VFVKGYETFVGWILPLHRPIGLGMSITTDEHDRTWCVCLVWQRVIDVLKVDAESAEWPFLRNVLNEDSDQLDTIRQLLLEIHTPRFKPQQMTKQDAIEMVFYAKKLKAYGFSVFCRRERNFCCKRFSPMMPQGVTEKCCQEIFYVNRRFLVAWRGLTVTTVLIQCTSRHSIVLSPPITYHWIVFAK